MCLFEKLRFIKPNIVLPWAARALTWMVLQEEILCNPNIIHLFNSTEFIFRISSSIFSHFLLNLHRVYKLEVCI